MSLCKTSHSGSVSTRSLCCCRALNAAASVHRLSGFQQAVLGDRSTPGILLHVAALTQACVSAGGLEQGGEGGWAEDATELLLDTWVELLQGSTTSQ